MILAIDAGTTESAYCLFDGEKPVKFGKVQNLSVLSMLRLGFVKQDEELVIEIVKSYGMPVGEHVFTTVEWIGRFCEAYEWHSYSTFGIVKQAKRLPRKEICKHICNDGRAKDSNIRQAIIDRFPATGGGKIPQIGIKSNPGPLYGVSKDVWSALAIAITFHETQLNAATHGNL